MHYKKPKKKEEACYLEHCGSAIGNHASFFFYVCERAPAWLYACGKLALIQKHVETSLDTRAHVVILLQIEHAATHLISETCGNKLGNKGRVADLQHWPFKSSTGSRHPVFLI